MFLTYLILTVLLSILLLLLTLIWYQNYSRFFKLISKIPGPPAIRFLGHFLDITSPTPEEHFLIDRKLAKEHYPIYSQWLVNQSAISLLSPEDVEVVLASNVLIRKSRIYKMLEMWLGTGLLTSDGSKWKSRRKLLTGTFHFSILQDFIPIFNEATQHLVSFLQTQLDRSYIDVVEPITEFTLHSIAETAMGIKWDAKLSQTKQYKSGVHNFGLVARNRMIRPWLYEDIIYNLTYGAYQSRKIVHVLHKFSTNVIKERKQTFKSVAYSTKKKMAMLDLLLTAQKNGEDITDAGIREEVDTFMFEGYDTTSIALSFALFLLANNPTIQDEARQEIIETIGDDATVPTFADLQQLPFTERCLKECMRLYPSVPFIAREAVEDFKTATGYTIPKGAMVHIPIYDLHRNPRFYPNPEKFDPDRFLPNATKDRHAFAYIPFSAGPRNCIGQKFALLELKAALCGILRNFYMEPIDRPKDIVFMREIVLRVKGQVKVRFIKRVAGQSFENRFETSS